MFLKKILTGFWSFINPLPTNYEPMDDSEYFPENGENFPEDSLEVKGEEQKKNNSMSFEEKKTLVELILKTKFRNMDSAEEIIKIIDTCEYHTEKVRIVEIYILEFAHMPPDLNDNLTDSFLFRYRMKRLSLTYLSLIESLVKTALELGDSVDSFSDFFTRVVFAQPYSIFGNETARAYALFRGTWLLHNHAKYDIYDKSFFER